MDNSALDDVEPGRIIERIKALGVLIDKNRVLINKKSLESFRYLAEQGVLLAKLQHKPGDATTIEWGGWDTFVKDTFGFNRTTANLRIRLGRVWTVVEAEYLRLDEAAREAGELYEPRIIDLVMMGENFAGISDPDLPEDETKPDAPKRKKAVASRTPSNAGKNSKRVPTVPKAQLQLQVREHHREVERLQEENNRLKAEVQILREELEITKSNLQAARAELTQIRAAEVGEKLQIEA
jgi:hypothetical protein